MKRIFTMIMAAAMLAACSKDVTEEIIGTSGNDDAANNTLLQVRTRSGGGDDGGESAELTLLSPNEGTAQGSDASVNSALASLGAASVSGWGVPTKAQMQLVEAKLLGDDASLEGEKYLYRKSNDGLGYRSLGADASAWPTASATGSYRLRPVAVVSVTKD